MGHGARPVHEARQAAARRHDAVAPRRLQVAGYVGRGRARQERRHRGAARRVGDRLGPGRKPDKRPGETADHGTRGAAGRKTGLEADGRRVPVGGGAYSGKDPSKVDRSAAYMARHIAKAVVTYRGRGAKECVVQIAYGIGQLEPEMITAVTDSGEDV